MKQQRVTRTRCKCDHCGRVNYSPSHMVRHEQHCTRNPNRECGFCCDPKRKPPAEVAAEISALAVRSGIFDLSNGEEVVRRLLALTKGCPGCALAAVRLSGLREYLPSNLFHFESLKKEWWRGVDERALREGDWR